jgi:hypothetical protein
LTGRTRIRNGLLAAVLALATPALLGCGSGESGGQNAVGGAEQSRQTEAQTEAIYVETGGLKYQVQLSRVLNPADVEDQAYLKGLPNGEQDLGSADTWFAIFMRVENSTKEDLTPTADYKITDTEDKTYTPVALDTDTNVFAYVPHALPPGGLLPDVNSPAGQGVIQGALVLFRLEIKTLQHRPLKLHFTDPDSGQEGIIDLDV